MATCPSHIVEALSKPTGPYRVGCGDFDWIVAPPTGGEHGLLSVQGSGLTRPTPAAFGGIRPVGAPPAAGGAGLRPAAPGGAPAQPAAPPPSLEKGDPRSVFVRVFFPAEPAAAPGTRGAVGSSVTFSVGSPNSVRGHSMGTGLGLGLGLGTGPASGRSRRICGRRAHASL